MLTGTLFSISPSDTRTSASSTSWPSGRVRSTVIDFLFRAWWLKEGPRFHGRSPGSRFGNPPIPPAIAAIACVGRTTWPRVVA